MYCFPSRMELVCKSISLPQVRKIKPRHRLLSKAGGVDNLVSWLANKSSWWSQATHLSLNEVRLSPNVFKLLTAKHLTRVYLCVIGGLVAVSELVQVLFSGSIPIRYEGNFTFTTNNNKNCSIRS